MTSPAADDRIRRVAILGGGTAGWMAAAALTASLDRGVSVTLVESDEIGTVGVGEATIPTIHWFNQLVGLDAEQFMRDTRATFKLGIEFVDWYAPGERYVHPFGRYGLPGDPVAFHHRFIRDRATRAALGEYALATVAARAGRFALPSPDPRSLLSQLGYAYHFDASLYARHLRALSEARGAKRIEGKVASVERHAEGYVRALVLERGERIEADLFLDCSGFRALLIGQHLGAEFLDWSTWLPCDRALAVPCSRPRPPEPFTRSTARAAGWQWRIPLQHRIGNGLVYASGLISDQAAADELLANLDGTPQAEPRMLRFKAGRRTESWRGNVVAVGLSGGFLEPLESTSIHLIQSAVAKLLALFPTRATMALCARQFNRQLNAEIEGIRDFLILHYRATTRPEPLWQACRAAPLPDSLAERFEQFTQAGRLVLDPEELFREASWFSVLVGQGFTARDYPPLLDRESEADNRRALAQTRQTLAAAVATMPTHEAVLGRLLDGPARAVGGTAG
jgi:tryptophan halogenase